MRQTKVETVIKCPEEAFYETNEGRNGNKIPVETLYVTNQLEIEI